MLHTENMELMAAEKRNAVHSSPRRDLFFFCLKFIGLCALLYTLINVPPAQFLTEPINEYTAAMTGLLLSIVGIDSSVSGVVIRAGDFSVRIITECSAVFIIDSDARSAGSTRRGSSITSGPNTVQMH